MLVRSTIRTQNLIDWKPAPSSVVNCSRLNANSFRPFIDGKRLSVELNKQSRLLFLSIVRLFCSRCPSAVTRLIVAVVVNAVNRIIKAGTFAHVIAKCLKRVQPSITDRDSAFSVAVESGRERTKATIFHRVPRAISWRIGFAVGNTSFSGNINREASATSSPVANRLIPQVRTGPKTFVAARAQTVPDYEVLGVSPRKGNDGKSAESVPSEVENSVIEFRTLKTFAMINLSHDQFLVSEGWLWLEPKRRYSAARLASLYPSNCEVCNVAW